MRPILRAIGVLAVLGSLLVASGISKEEYRARRQALRKAASDGAVILFGAQEDETGNLRTGFFQDSNFLYLTGWTEPNAILVILPESAEEPREALFLPPRNPASEKWTGPKSDPEDRNLADRIGFEHVESTKSLGDWLASRFQDNWKCYQPERAPVPDALKHVLAKCDPANVEPLLARLRMTKSPAEISLIQKSIDATIAAHRAAWKMIRPGLFEYQIAAAMGAVYFGLGCQRHAYAPIVGSGPNSAILHYSRNDRRIEAGDLVLMDVGAECSGYAADITRTIPAGSDFTRRQKEIYDVVLGAQKAVIAAVKPGMTLGRTTPNSLFRIAKEYLDAHGKDRNGKPLGEYLLHGIGHHVGLDVHDAWIPDSPLEEGMVITIEPGVYLPDEGFGIRIEDMVLVTKDGAELLSRALPREWSEIRKLRR